MSGHDSRKRDKRCIAGFPPVVDLRSISTIIRSEVVKARLFAISVSAGPMASRCVAVISDL